MSLSNTMVPIYYEQFRKDVIMGRIPVSETISMEMNRIDKLIRSPGVYYDPDATEGWIEFCENELTLTDGSDWHMLNSFKLWAEQVYGWYYFIDQSVFVPFKNGHGGRYEKRTVKKRLTTHQYLIVGRGAAKSLYATGHQGYGLIVDPTTTHNVTTAPTMKQAEEVLDPLKTAITRSKGPLFKMMTYGSINNTTGAKANRVKLASTKNGIENFITNSLLEIRPMTIDKLQGLRNKYTTIDEWLSGDTREDVMTAVEQGASKIPNSLIIATSSEGTVRNGPGDDIKMSLMSILKGEYIAPHISIWWYKLDDIKEIKNPKLWVKANPNIGITVSEEEYRKDVDKAEHNPAARNDILAKRFGIPMEGYTYFFTYQETLRHRKRDYWGLPCALGADLSRGDDFCAFTFLFPLKREEFGIKTRSYITERTLDQLPLSMRKKYNEFIEEGTLIIMPGTVLDMSVVYDDLEQMILDFEYNVLCFGYDPYGAKAFVERYQRENGEFGVEKVIQGSKTESIPLGELKKMAADRLLLFDEKIMEFCMGNCIVLEDTNGNRKLYKKRQDQKIDNVAALMDAYVAYKLYKEMFE